MEQSAGVRALAVRLASEPGFRVRSAFPASNRMPDNRLGTDTTDILPRLRNALAAGT